MVPSETCEISYTGTGAQVAFPTTFSYLGNSELRVSVTTGAVESVKVLGVDYTATNPATASGESATGTVTFGVAPALGTTVKIQRKVPFTNPTALRTIGTFSPSVHEDSFDELTYQTQQLDRRLKALESAGAVGSVVAGNGLVFSSATQIDVNAGTGILLSGDAVNVDFMSNDGVHYPTAVAANTNDPGASNQASRADHTHNVSTAAPAAVVPGAVASAGTAATLARSDHGHSVAVAAPGAVSNVAAAAGAAASFARSDHVHSVSSAAAVALTDATNAAGAAATLALSDHTHSHGARGGGTLHAVATTGAAGFMSATDKVKLDGLATETVTEGTTQTNSATPKTIVQFQPGTNTTETVHLKIAAKKLGATGAAGYHRAFTLQNLDGTLSLIGAVTDMATHETDAAWDVGVTIVSPVANVTVTGAAGITIDWRAVAKRTAAP